MAKIDFSAIRIRQGKNVSYQTKITTSSWTQIRSKISKCKADCEKQVGYQREPEKGRVNECFKYIKTGMPCLGNVMLNIRDQEALTWKGIANNQDIGVLTIDLDKIEHLWVVDGQHRTGGYGELLKWAGNQGVDITYDIPCVITNQDEDWEKILFWTTNVGQRPVSGDLKSFGTLDLHANVMSEKDWKDMPRVIRTNVDWKVKAEACARMVAFESAGQFAGNVFVNRFAFPNQPRDDSKLFKFYQFVNYFRPVLNDKNGIMPGDPKKIAVIVSNLFQAVTQLMPQTLEDHSNYYVFKHVGISSLFQFCPRVVEAINDKKKPQDRGVPTVAEFVQVLEKLGKYMTEDYWHRDTEEGASGFHGLKRVTMLVTNFEAALNANAKPVAAAA